MSDPDRQHKLEQQALALRLTSRVLSISEVLTGWLLLGLSVWFVRRAFSGSELS